MFDLSLNRVITMRSYSSPLHHPNGEIRLKSPEFLFSQLNFVYTLRYNAHHKIPTIQQYLEDRPRRHQDNEDGALTEEELRGAKEQLLRESQDDTKNGRLDDGDEEEQAQTVGESEDNEVSMRTLLDEHYIVI